MKCICCKKTVKKLYPEHPYCRPESDMWDDGGVHTFVPGYGSKFDCEQFIVCICDKCLTKRVKQGIITQKNYE